MEKEKQPTSQLRLNIELADNGVIMRDRDYPDSVKIEKYDETETTDTAVLNRHIHRMIGCELFEWFINVVILEHTNDWMTTGCDIDITFKLTGKPMQSVTE